MKLKNPDLYRDSCYINGKWERARSQESLPVYNPSTKKVLAKVPCMGEEETKEAIYYATLAFPLWKKKLAKERSALLQKWYDLIVENAADLAVLLTSEQGKPLEEAVAEIHYGASFLQWFAE